MAIWVCTVCGWEYDEEKGLQMMALKRVQHLKPYLLISNAQCVARRNPILRSNRNKKFKYFFEKFKLA